MALRRERPVTGQGRRKRLSFDSPVRERAASKRFQFDTSSSEEEEVVGMPGEMERLCMDLSNFSPCSTMKEEDSPCKPPSLLRKRPVSRLPSSTQRRRAPSPSSPFLHRLSSPANLQNPRRLNLTPNSEKSTNINPFTPAAMRESSLMKRSRRSSTASSSSSSSRSSLDSSFDLDSEDDDLHTPPSKRLCASDVQVCRYEEEFLQMHQLAAGQFGTVTLARHRLDGILYAIKITKESMKGGSSAERVAMKEVWAHAVLKKHKNVVGYYNSWVEDDRVYIQNEYCEGGSLGMQINQKKEQGQRFTEAELTKILVNSLSGLKYIHSKQLAHLDIKPDNIFITKEKDQKVQDWEQTSDLGSTDEEDLVDEEDEEVCYKIGDLGHVVPADGGSFGPEEGDCRYMAPEFLHMEEQRTHLAKADIFSLGMTVFEAASLITPPKNSSDSVNGHRYTAFKQGQLPYLEDFSAEFNSLLASMVAPNPRDRPSARTLLSSPALLVGEGGRTRKELLRELKEAREKYQMFKKMLNMV